MLFDVTRDWSTGPLAKSTYDVIVEAISPLAQEVFYFVPGSSHGSRRRRDARLNYWSGVHAAMSDHAAFHGHVGLRACMAVGCDTYETMPRSPSVVKATLTKAQVGACRALCAAVS